MYSKDKPEFNWSSTRAFDISFIRVSLDDYGHTPFTECHYIWNQPSCCDVCVRIFLSRYKMVAVLCVSPTIRATRIYRSS